MCAISVSSYLEKFQNINTPHTKISDNSDNEYPYILDIFSDIFLEFVVHCEDLQRSNIVRFVRLNQ